MSAPLTKRRRVANARTATSTSSRVQLGGSQRNAAGRTVRRKVTFSNAELLSLKKEEEEREAERRANMNEAERRDHERMRDLPEDDDAGYGYEGEVLRGEAIADISHAGEDLTEEAIEEADISLLEQLRAHHNQLFPRARDKRTRTNRTQILVDAFAAQMEAMTDAYVSWDLETAQDGLASVYTQPRDAEVEETNEIFVVDLFSAYYADVPIIKSDVFVASAYVRQGLMPVAPHFPSVVISIRALEVFRTTSLRCPRLGVQAFVRALCDLHGVPPRGYLATQFRVAFDVYLAIR
ncbi:hypothetical protein B0H15DRAFT_948248 [Mycena belliarum]|uniref:Uncharacterized protein n=1 Tax=Mycena belliarum TaxID=1033014 RepID=A0AAD6UAX6_9AGAR|nr:hypothetical protein B0H15DRAFT_948248 [Mycena belliae]